MTPDSPRSRVPWVALIGAVITMTASAFFVVLLADFLTEPIGRKFDWFSEVITATGVVIVGGGAMASRGDPIREIHSLSLPTTFIFLGGALGAAIGVVWFAISPWHVAWTTVGAAISGAIWWWKSRRLNRLLRHGYHAEGVFEKIGTPDTSVSASYHGLKYTVVFIDSSGREARVTGEEYFKSSRIPSTGDIALVWVDPQNPRRHIVRQPPSHDPGLGRHLAQDREVPGVIEQVRTPPVTVPASTVQVGYVVSFTGHDGTPMRQAGIASSPVGNPLTRGERVIVWYHPTKPGRHAIRREGTLNYDL